MPFTNIKNRELVPGQGIAKLKHCEQKMVYSILNIMQRFSSIIYIWTSYMYVSLSVCYIFWNVTLFHICMTSKTYEQENISIQTRQFFCC